MNTDFRPRRHKSDAYYRLNILHVVRNDYVFFTFWFWCLESIVDMLNFVQLSGC